MDRFGYIWADVGGLGQLGQIWANRAATVARAEIAGGSDSRFLLFVATLHFPWPGSDQAPGHSADGP